MIGLVVPMVWHGRPALLRRMLWRRAGFFDVPIRHRVAYTVRSKYNVGIDWCRCEEE